MKRIVSGLFVGALIFSAVPVWAMSPEEAREARYKEIREIKEKQRMERETVKKTGQTPPSRWSEFWQKEGERSGLGQSGSRMTGWMKNLNPVPFFQEQGKKYEERKSSSKS